jgi:hypothetical protein
VGEEYRWLSPSLWSFLYSPVTSSFLGPNILLNTLFSNTLKLRFSYNVSYQVSHPYKTTEKIIILYTFIFGARGGVVIEALRYKPEGLGFDGVN